ncbi:MAG: glycosyltransferase family 4 protein [Candidatus Electrothrix sp. AW1]|nr:glycosyltransferase family 4 protein [Candidatus Electrothrix sp. AX1]MCI5181605.1 glycosyltransferase family 4 protein [Candidatus Electrothrix gigas]MCI5226013.1 glycosyltransferase family 4 protein [Candidatus Electrothrix gigas]
MKLLFVVGDISACGGTERATVEIASALSETEHDVTVLSLFGPADPFFKLSDKVRICSTGLKEAQKSIRRSVLISKALYSNCFAYQAEAMILVDTILFAFCLPWLPLSRTCIICWEHFHLGTDHGSKFRNIARCAASKLSKRIVVLTERDADAWRDKYGIRDRVQAIWNPVPRFSITETERETCSIESCVVLAVGRLTYQKGLDVLLKAWELLGSDKSGWRLRIVGDGEEYAKLIRLAKELEIVDSVVVAGQSKKIENEYRNASIYVMSSRWEGLPMTLLEAQRFGLPCVSTDCMTGPREILSCNNGLLVPVEDPVALAQGLKKVMENPELRRRFSHAALQNVDRYDVETVGNQWGLLLSKLGC